MTFPAIGARVFLVIGWNDDTDGTPDGDAPSGVFYCPKSNFARVRKYPANHCESGAGFNFPRIPGISALRLQKEAQNRKEALVIGSSAKSRVGHGKAYFSHLQGYREEIPVEFGVIR